MGNLTTEFILPYLKRKLPQSKTKPKISENVKKFSYFFFKLTFRQPVSENLVAPTWFLIAQASLASDWYIFYIFRAKFLFDYLAGISLPDN